MIQSAVAAQHVKDMLDHAAEESRVREARRNRPSRRWRRSNGLAVSSRATRRDPATSQCCPE
jgi:hypothetical protein